MDSFKDFFERLEILKVAERQDNILSCDASESSQFIIDEDITVDLSRNGVSQEYFDKVDNASTCLVSFYERHIATATVHNALYDTIMSYKRRSYDDLKLCLMIDVIRCYIGLGHPMSLNTKEGLGLLILLVKMYKPNYMLTYEGLSTIPESVINLDSLVPYIGACSDEINIAAEKSIISTLLQQTKKNEDKLFRELFYRFCEAISEADGKISISEKEWLMTILNLDDDDITNDINIDSIFTR